MSRWFHSTPESEELLAEERLVVAATEAVAEAMHSKGVNSQQLAERLGVRPSEVSQRLSGRRNLTLRTFARMLHVLGMRAKISIESNDEPFTAGVRWNRSNAVLSQFMFSGASVISPGAEFGSLRNSFYISNAAIQSDSTSAGRPQRFMAPMAESALFRDTTAEIVDVTAGARARLRPNVEIAPDHEHRPTTAYWHGSQSVGNHGTGVLKSARRMLQDEQPENLTKS